MTVGPPHVQNSPLRPAQMWGRWGITGCSEGTEAQWERQGEGWGTRINNSWVLKEG